MAPKLSDLSKLPPKQKLLVAVLVSVVVAVGYYYLYYSDASKKIDVLQGQLRQMSSTIKEQEVIARNLPSFRLEVTKLEEDLKLLLDQLPNSAELPSLLNNLSELARESRLDVLKFTPKPEIKKDFYAEIPVSVAVYGNYRSFIVFADKVSHLPRIVNLSDITFAQPKRGGDGQMQVNITCQAMTFRFLEQAPAPAPAAAPAAGKGAGK